MIYYKRRSVTKLPWPDGDGIRITYFTCTFNGNYKSLNISEDYTFKEIEPVRGCDDEQ